MVSLLRKFLEKVNGIELLGIELLGDSIELLSVFCFYFILKIIVKIVWLDFLVFNLMKEEGFFLFRMKRG